MHAALFSLMERLVSERPASARWHRAPQHTPEDMTCAQK